MNENKKDEELLKLSQKSIRQDILLFKEEVLKDVKNSERQFKKKFGLMEDLLKEQMDAYELKVKSFEERIMNISNLVSSDRTILEKIEELNKFKDEIKDKVLTDSIKLSNIEIDYKTNLKNIESILASSVIYPGIIGYSGKFKTFHQFMDYVLKEISELNFFKEKSILDLGPYKKKIDESLEYVKLQVNHIIGSTNEFTIKHVSDSEQRLKSLIQLYDDRLQDTRVENAHYSIGLQKKSEELSGLIKNMYEIKEDIYKKLKDEVKNMKIEQKNLTRYFTGYRKQFTLIKDKFTQLSEFIRDVRFRANLGTDTKKRDFVNMAKQIDFNLGSTYNKRRNMGYGRGDIDFNNDNLDFLDTPFTEPNNKFFSNTIGKNKRNSVQAGLNLFSNKIIKKFDSTNKKKEDSKDSNDSNKILKTHTHNKKNEFFEIGGKKLSMNRRNTATLLFPNKFNKEFSDFNQKNLNFNIIPNNDNYNLKKENEDISVSIESNSDDKSKSKTDNNEPENIKKKNTLKKQSIEKKHEIIKEEDENNNSETIEIKKEEKKRKSIKVKDSQQINYENNLKNNKTSNSGPNIIEKEKKK